MTKPSAAPSSAETRRAVKIMPMARFRPIWRGRRCRPPAKAAKPTFGSGKAKTALSEAMIRSQARAISKPPPMATPLTAAIRGLVRSKRDVKPAKPLGGDPILPPVAWCFRSLPAEKARSPAPVTMPTHWSGSDEKSLNTSCSSKWASEWRAFITSGRFRMMVVIGPLRSTFTC